jgi:NPCBM/NEW2 domain-containing protein
MRLGRARFWAIGGGAFAAVVVVLALFHVDSGTPSKAASSPGPAGSTGSRGGGSAPVVTPRPSGTSTFSYLSDLHPSGKLGELVNPGPVKISGSIYPKSISFYCNVGDPTAFPSYTLRTNARRFQATIGLAPGSPKQFGAGILFVGDGRTLRTVTVKAPKPRTVDVDVKGVHTLRLECFGSGNSYTGGEAVDLVWGNARITEAG